MNILDLFKRQPPKPGTDDFDIFSKFVNQFDFFDSIFSLYDPDELSRRYGGIKGLKKMYKQDSDIKSSIEKRFAPLNSCVLNLVDSDEQEIDFMWALLKDHVPAVIKVAKKSVLYGYGVGQIVWDFETDRIARIKKIIPEKSEHFKPLIDGESVRKSTSTKIEPLGKYLLGSVDLDPDFPTGDALLARLYTIWTFKLNGLDYWATFMKKMAGGFLIGKVTRDDMVTKMREFLDKAFKSASIAYSGGDQANVSLQFPASNGEAFRMFETLLLDKYNRLTLGETLTSNMPSGGSYAAAEVHNGVRLEKVESDILVVEDLFNKLIRYLHFYNNRTAPVPVAKFVLGKGLNAERATRDNTLGKFIKFTEVYFKRHFGLEDDEFEVLESPQNGGGLGSLFSQLPQRKPAMRSEEDAPSDLQFAAVPKEDLTPEFQRIEELVELLERTDTTPLTADQILLAIQTSPNKAELEKNLGVLITNDSDDFKELMTQSMLLASIYGIEDANKQAEKE